MLPDRLTEAELDRVQQASEDPLVAAALRGAHARSLSQEEHLDRLQAEADRGAWDLTRLPFLFAPQVQREHVELLAERLAET